MFGFNNSKPNSNHEFNIFDKESMDALVESITQRFSDTFEKEIAEQLKKIKIEYKRDEQNAINTGITARPEEAIKRWVCPRIPKWVNPDMLTGLGVIAILMVAAGFVLGFFNKYYLGLVVVGLILHWFGDSFDGSLARYRKKTRPNYGYYIDHIVDALAIMVFGIGLGLSGFVKIELGLLFTAVYLAMMLHVDMITYVQNEFRYSFGLIGPTEIRIMGIFVTIYMFLAPVRYFDIYGHSLTQYDLVFAGMSVAMFVVLVFSILQKGIELDRIDRETWVEES